MRFDTQTKLFGFDGADERNRSRYDSLTRSNCTAESRASHCRIDGATVTFESESGRKVPHNRRDDEEITRVELRCNQKNIWPLRWGPEGHPHLSKGTGPRSVSSYPILSSVDATGVLKSVWCR